MSGSDTTTVSVDRRTTKRKLDRLLLDLKERSPNGERVSMDDLISEMIEAYEPSEDPSSGSEAVQA